MLRQVNRKHRLHHPNRKLVKNMDENKAWIDTSDLNNNNIRIDMVNRTARQGGGMALLHKVEYINSQIRNQLTVRHNWAWNMVNHNKKQKTHPSWSIPPTDRIINRQHTCKIPRRCKSINSIPNNQSHKPCPIRWFQHTCPGHRKSWPTDLQ